MVFCDWFLSLSQFSRFIYAVASIFLLPNVPLCRYVLHVFIHPSVDEHLHCLPFWSIVNNAIIETYFIVHVFFWGGDIYCIRSRIAGSFGNFIIFNTSGNCQTIFQNGCIILHSHHRWMRFLIPCQKMKYKIKILTSVCFAPSVFFYVTILVGIKCLMAS